MSERDMEAILDKAKDINNDDLIELCFYRLSEEGVRQAFIALLKDAKTPPYIVTLKIFDEIWDAFLAFAQKIDMNWAWNKDPYKHKKLYQDRFYEIYQKLTNPYVRGDWKKEAEEND